MNIIILFSEIMNTTDDEKDRTFKTFINTLLSLKTDEAKTELIKIYRECRNETTGEFN